MVKQVTVNADMTFILKSIVGDKCKYEIDGNGGGEDNTDGADTDVGDNRGNEG